MPNHVTSVITLSGDESRIKAMLEQIKNDEVGIRSILGRGHDSTLRADDLYEQGTGGEAESSHGG